MGQSQTNVEVFKFTDIWLYADSLWWSGIISVEICDVKLTLTVVYWWKCIIFILWYILSIKYMTLKEEYVIEKKWD